MGRLPGAFVVFEGGEGSGKSTQARLLAEWLESRGFDVVSARDPGGTPIGEAIRGVLLDPASEPMNPVTELLLYVAARAQLVREVVEPALADGKVVVLDRFDDSTYAYQALGRALDAEQVAAVNELATGGLRPDLVVLLDVPPEEGRRRRREDLQRPGDDRLESEAMAFHERVRQAYRARAAAEPDRFLVVDGRAAPAEIQQEVWRRVRALLEPAIARGAR